MTKNTQRKWIVMVRLPNRTMTNIILPFKPRPGSVLEDGSRVVKVQ